MAVDATKAPRARAEEIRQRQAAGENVVFLDMRKGSWNRSDVKIAGAIRVPIDELEEHLADLPREATLAAYCT